MAVIIPEPYRIKVIEPIDFKYEPKILRHFTARFKEIPRK
ncbi:hypothetical protein PTE_01165 [Photorhabdus khanii NC19]|uniref:Uncharacterized protein n=1 Tax=Photorhabdus khanii NC19 TaxID=1004151 RepID=W3V9P3_9GAMM|nr:hypothetical protein PTE_01165 [Photorhabdus khanii NC19]